MSRPVGIDHFVSELRPPRLPQAAVLHEETHRPARPDDFGRYE